jgi:hypothetical protein
MDPFKEPSRFKKALEAVSKLLVSELPAIPAMPQAAESWRRIAALHRELSRLSTKKEKTYFLSYGDAAKVFSGLSHQTAYNITPTLGRFGVIKIVSKVTRGFHRSNRPA